MLETRKELKELIAAKGAEIEAITADLAEAEAAAIAAREDSEARVIMVVEAKAEIERLTAENVQLAADLAEARETIDATTAENEELQEAAVVTDDKVAVAAAAELAAAGHEPVEVVDEPVMTRAEFDRQYNAISDGRERAKWFLANKHRIHN